MKKGIFCFFVLFAMLIGGYFLLDAAPPLKKLPEPPSNPFISSFVPDEISMMQNLIATGEKNLDKQRQLLESIKKFNKTKSDYLQDSSNKDKASQTVKAADLAWGQIKEQELTHLFRPEFISDIEFFANITKK